jgi:aldehyde:ferredoxin oxidoreductase
MGGYMGKILKIDLTQGKITQVVLSDDFYQKWLGGYGLGAQILYDEIPANTDPLGPENIIGFTTGILTGTLTPFSGSFTVVGKSPLTGTWGDSRGGGLFGPELKYAGFDAVFFHGISAKPVYLWIYNGTAELKDASRIWGCNVTETEQLVKEMHDDARVQIASIGTSGERLSLISAIMTDEGRAAGRQGLGAVMGAKKLKGVAVRGTNRVPIYDLKKLRELRSKALETMKTNPFYDLLSKYGTSVLTYQSAFSGDSPVKNWKGVGKEDFPSAENLSGDNVIHYDTGPYGCFGCALACGGIQQVKDGPYAIQGHKPEYETLAAFGSMCLNDNLQSIIYLNYVCNDYGLDTISAGATIAFAMECYENGIITQEDTDGIALDWGNHATIVDMTLKMAKREGFGDVLADGVLKAAQRIGKGSEQYAMHVGGQELPMHDPRDIENPYNTKNAFMYIVDATPARHTQTPHEGFAVQAAGVCSFTGFVQGTGDDVPQFSDFINAVTGWQLCPADLVTIGDRIATMRHVFNIREGFKPSDFVYPDRVLGIPPLQSGPLAGVTVKKQVTKMVHDYFQSLDWDLETGKPSRKKLIDLGLANIAKDLVY